MDSTCRWTVFRGSRPSAWSWRHAFKAARTVSALTFGPSKMWSLMPRAKSAALVTYANVLEEVNLTNTGRRKVRNMGKKVVVVGDDVEEARVAVGVEWGGTGAHMQELRKYMVIKFMKG